MDTPTRRDLFKIAVGATLASALPVACCKDNTCMPLAINLIGPMGFTMGKNPAGDPVVDVWMPDLTQDKPDRHEAGIVTPKTSFKLDTGDYTLTGPVPFSGPTPTPYASNCTVYPAPVKPDVRALGNTRYIHLTLPMPHFIVALDPVKAKIYAVGSTPPTSPTPYAVGLRFLYDRAFLPTLTSHGGTSRPIPFDIVPGEIQLNMSIEHTAFDRKDDDHSKAQDVFVAVAKFFLNEDLQAKIIDDSPATGANPSLESSPLHNCKSPIILGSA